MRLHFIDTYKRNSDMLTYSFSPAQKVFFTDLSQDKIEKLRNIIISHFRAKRQKYSLVQDIFYNQIGIDNYLFSDLCYCESLEDEQDIIYEYFTAFEDLESENQIDNLLNVDYLNSYPELKIKIKDYLIKYQLI